MKVTYQLEDLDCANCAAKMERAISELPEVQNVSVSFLMQKMVIEFQEDADQEKTIKKIVKLIRKVEPDCRVIL